jgi:hypothetical protein
MEKKFTASHDNVDYFPNCKTVQDFDHSTVWESDRRRAKVVGTHHIMKYSCDPIQDKVE